MTTSSNSPSGGRTSRSGWALSFLVLLLVVYACVRLGWWQWQRAAEFKAAEQPVADLPRVPLEEITSPLINLPREAEGRLVETSGRYVRAWTVPDRQSGERTGVWSLALLDRGDGSGVLVVRGWSVDEPLPDGAVDVQGRLMPSQNPELTASVRSDDQIGRVDPALVISQSELDLFDGYVIASSESPGTDMERVSAPEVRKSPPGYYLQHVAYVILWWFFGLIALLVWTRAFIAAVLRRTDAHSEEGPVDS